MRLTEKDANTDKQLADIYHSFRMEIASELDASSVRELVDLKYE